MSDDVQEPRQPIYVDEDGVPRFRPNTIIEWLFEARILDLNLIRTMPFPDADRRQLAQLLGYSVSGYYGLDYAKDDPVPEPEYQETP